MTILDLIKNAMYEINSLAPGEDLAAADADICLNKLNRLFDNWNAESLFIFGTQLAQFTLIPSRQPHTIGPTGSGADWIVATARPPRIDKADLVITDVSPQIRRPMRVVDEAWWMANPAPTIETQIPYYLYPNYGWPLGQIYLWPVPGKNYDILMNLWTLFASVSLTTAFTMPPGYEDAVTLSLAEAVFPVFHERTETMNPMTVEAARLARARVKSLNAEAPEMACDAAVQSVNSRPQSSMANFLSGFID